MKILMISPQPFFTPRGTPFSVYYRTRALSDMGHSIDLVTYHIGRDVTLPGLRILRTLKIPFIHHVKIGPSLKKLFLDVFVFWKAFWLLVRNRYDVIHAHEEAIFFCLVYRLFFPKISVVYDMHSSLPQQLRNFAYAKNKLLIGLFSFLERLSIKFSHSVITICPALQTTVEEMKVKTPSILIENSLCEKVALSDRGDIISDDLIDWDKFKGRHMILYTGTFEHYQGIPMLLESVKKVVESHPKALFVLIGGAPRQVVTMRDRAVKLGIQDSIVLTGNLHPNTVKCFIEKAQVLVSPRVHGTNTPLKIYEYLASNKPIVATAHPTHTQVLTDQEALLADCDPTSFAQAILTLLDKPNLRKAIPRHAKALYERSYGNDVYLERLKKVFDLATRTNGHVKKKEAALSR